MDQDVYSSSDFYPCESFEVNFGSGLKDGEHVIYFAVRCFSQYSSGLDIIKIPRIIEISVEYSVKDVSIFDSDEFDLLIITDESFVSDLQPLVDHKNSIGIKTIIQTVQDIYPISWWS